MKSLEELYKERSRIDSQISRVKETCKCPVGSLVKKEYYDRGGYLDRASTKTWDECSVCGKRYNEKRVSHDWYG